MTRKLVRLSILHLITATVLTVGAYAQQQNCTGLSMNPSYDAYSSGTYSGGIFYSTVTIDGTTTGYCPRLHIVFGGPAPWIHQQYSGRQWGMASWQFGTLEQYLTSANDQSISGTGVTPGVRYIFESEAQVICSFLGAFAIFPFPDLDFGEAVTITKSTTPRSNAAGLCIQQNACTNTTAPECAVVAVSLTPAGSDCLDYYETFVLYFGTVCSVGLSLYATGPGICTTKPN